MKQDFVKLIEKAEQKANANKAFFEAVSKNPPKTYDQDCKEIHDAVFEKTDCLDCANCCKTTGPLFNSKDIDQISKHLSLTPHQFVNEYLKKDEDGDWVLQTLPCFFLDKDNKCTIYEHRPQACREYPHTDRIKNYEIKDLTLENVKICPAAFEIVEKMRLKMNI
tara:strand:+ start:2469 stop:2963 length:495 start_codon:yes stop_codon:yes gene_type:complete